MLASEALLRENRNVLWTTEASATWDILKIVFYSCTTLILDLRSFGENLEDSVIDR